MYNYGDMDWAVRAPRFVLFIVTVSNVGGGEEGGGGQLARSIMEILNSRMLIVYYLLSRTSDYLTMCIVYQLYIAVTGNPFYRVSSI